MNRQAGERSVVLLWRSLGPYHIARAAAADKLLRQRCGVRVIAVELSDQEQSHAWRVDRSRLPITLHTVVPGVTLHAAKPRPGLVSQTMRILDELKPLAVAIAGYD